MRPLSSFFALFFVPFGCAGGQDTGSADVIEYVESIEYYEVTGNGVWQGSWSYETHMAAIRVLRPETSTIFEHFIGLGEEAGEEYEVNSVVDLENDTFTYTSEDYEGSGVLYGDAWDWHAWESTSTAIDGSGSVVSQDTKDENGIVAFKIGYDADGEEQWTLEEILTPITEAEWLALQDDTD